MLAPWDRRPYFLIYKGRQPKIASSGNRTRAARVAGEHSTTEPTMLHERQTVIVQSVWAGLNVRCLINVNGAAWMPQLWKMNKGLS